MTRDDVIRMAREAGFHLSKNDAEVKGFDTQLFEFAALVADKEREACAKAYEKEAESWLAWPQSGSAKRKGAAAIRARGEKGGAEC